MAQLPTGARISKQVGFYCASGDEVVTLDLILTKQQTLNLTLNYLSSSLELHFLGATGCK